MLFLGLCDRAETVWNRMDGKESVQLKWPHTQMSLNALCWATALQKTVAGGRPVPRVRIGASKRNGNGLETRMPTVVFGSIAKAKIRSTLAGLRRGWLEVWPMKRDHDIWQIESGEGCPTKLTSYSR